MAVTAKHQNRAVLLMCLTVLGMLAQIVPFVLHTVPDAAAVSALAPLPASFPSGYTIANYAKARAFDQALFGAGVINTLATLLGLLALLRCGISERVGAVAEPKLQAWLIRILFLMAVWLFFRLLDFPYAYCRFQHYRAFGMSALNTWAWLKLYLVGLPIPLVLFVLRGLMVICILPLCGRFWWLAGALGLFLLGSVIPELVSRSYPLDPVETLQAIVEGSHASAMKSQIHKAGLELPIMVVDESRRSSRANICLTGRAGREYVLVTDTFLQHYTPEQVALALAHELGHFQHQTRILIFHKLNACLELLLSFGIAFLLTGRRPLPVSFGPRVVLLAKLCGLLVSNALTPFSLALLRQEERYADRCALQSTGKSEAYGHLLLEVAQRELEPLDLPPWEYYLSASHPTFKERITSAGRK